MVLTQKLQFLSDGAGGQMAIFQVVAVNVHVWTRCGTVACSVEKMLVECSTVLVCTAHVFCVFCVLRTEIVIFSHKKIQILLIF